MVLRDRAALERARADVPGLEAIRAEEVRPSLHLYTRASDVASEGVLHLG